MFLNTSHCSKCSCVLQPPEWSYSTTTWIQRVTRTNGTFICGSIWPPVRTHPGQKPTTRAPAAQLPAPPRCWQWPWAHHVATLGLAWECPRASSSRVQRTPHRTIQTCSPTRHNLSLANRKTLLLFWLAGSPGGSDWPESLERHEHLH